MSAGTATSSVQAPVEGSNDEHFMILKGPGDYTCEYFNGHNRRSERNEPHWEVCITHDRYIIVEQQDGKFRVFKRRAASEWGKKVFSDCAFCVRLKHSAYMHIIGEKENLHISFFPFDNMHKKTCKSMTKEEAYKSILYWAATSRARGRSANSSMVKPKRLRPAPTIDARRRSARIVGSDVHYNEGESDVNEDVYSDANEGDFAVDREETMDVDDAPENEPGDSITSMIVPDPITYVSRKYIFNNGQFICLFCSKKGKRVALQFVDGGLFAPSADKHMRNCGADETKVTTEFVIDGNTLKADGYDFYTPIPEVGFCSTCLVNDKITKAHVKKIVDIPKDHHPNCISTSQRSDSQESMDDLDSERQCTQQTLSSSPSLLRKQPGIDGSSTDTISRTSVAELNVSNGSMNKPHESTNGQISSSLDTGIDSFDVSLSSSTGPEVHEFSNGLSTLSLSNGTNTPDVPIRKRRETANDEVMRSMDIVTNSFDISTSNRKRRGTTNEPITQPADVPIKPVFELAPSRRRHREPETSIDQSSNSMNGTNSHVLPEQRMSMDSARPVNKARSFDSLTTIQSPKTVTFSPVNGTPVANRPVMSPFVRMPQPKPAIPIRRPSRQNQPIHNRPTLIPQASNRSQPDIHANDNGNMPTVNLRRPRTSTVDSAPRMINGNSYVWLPEVQAYSLVEIVENRSESSQSATPAALPRLTRVNPSVPSPATNTTRSTINHLPRFTHYGNERALNASAWTTRKNAGNGVNVLVHDPKNFDNGWEFSVASGLQGNGFRALYCRYCNLTVGRVNLDTNTCYMKIDANHRCNSIPFQVFMQKYDDIAQHIKISDYWWRNKEREYHFLRPKNMTAAVATE